MTIAYRKAGQVHLNAYVEILKDCSPKPTKLCTLKPKIKDKCLLTSINLLEGMMNTCSMLKHSTETNKQTINK